MLEKSPSRHCETLTRHTRLQFRGQITFVGRITASVLLLMAFLVLMASGCGGSGGGASPTPTPTPVPLPRTTLTSDKTDILHGASTILHWTSEQATGVNASNFGAGEVNGALTVSPTTTTTYTITVRDASGATATASVTITVAPVIVTVASGGTIAINKALPLTATVGGAVDASVTWSILEANAGTITPDPTNPNAATYTAPASPGTFHLVAVSNADPTRSATAEIRVQSANGVVILK